jgi:hypothetical protein
MQSENPHLTEEDKQEQMDLLLEIFQQNVSEMLDETFNSLMGHPVQLPVEMHGPTHEHRANLGDDLAKSHSVGREAGARDQTNSSLCRRR